MDFHEYARKLREHANSAEVRLWEALSKSDLEGRVFLFQFVIEPFIVDFCCPEEMFVVEVDGGYHDTLKMKQMDAERDKQLAAQGYRTLRLKSSFVNENPEFAVEYIRSQMFLFDGVIPESKGLTRPVSSESDRQIAKVKAAAFRRIDGATAETNMLWLNRLARNFRQELSAPAIRCYLALMREWDLTLDEWRKLELKLLSSFRSLPGTTELEALYSEIVSQRTIA